MSKRRHRRDSNKKTTKGQFWSDEEHRKFVEGVAKFGAKAVNDISDYVGTRTPVQVRSHAQKYFIRLARDEAAKAMADETDKDKTDDRPSPDMVHALMNARLRERAALKKHKSFEHVTNNDDHGRSHSHVNNKGGITAVFTAGGHTGQSVVPLTPEAVREAKRQRHALHVAQRKRRQARKARLAATATAAAATVTATTAAATATGASSRTANDDEKNEEDDNTHDDNDDIDDSLSSSNHSGSDSDSNYSDHDHDDDDDDDNNGTKSYKRRRMNHTKKIGDVKGHYKKAASRRLTTRKNSSAKDDKGNDNDNGAVSLSSSLSVSLPSSSCMSGGKVKPQQPVSFNHDHDGNGDIDNDNDIKLKYESSSPWPLFSMPAPRPPYGMSINIDAPSTLTAPLRNGATCVRVHSPGVSLPHPSQLMNDTVKQEAMIGTPVKPVLSLPPSSSPPSSPLLSSSMSSPMSTSVCSCSDATPPNFPPASIYHHPNYHRAEISSPLPLPSAAPLMTINPNSNHAPLSRQLLSPLAPFRASPLSVPPISLLSCTVHGVDADPSHSSQNHGHAHNHGNHPPLISSLPLSSMIRMPLSSLPRSEPFPIPASRTPMMAAARIQPFWPIDHIGNGNSNNVGSASIVKQEGNEPATMSMPMVKGMGIASGLLSTPSMATIGRDSPMASMRSSLFPPTRMVPTRDIHPRASATGASSSSPVPPPSAGALKTKLALKAKERSSSISSTGTSKSLAKSTSRKPTKVSRSSITVYDDNGDGRDYKGATVQPKARGVTSTKISTIARQSSTSTNTAATAARVTHDNDNDNDAYTPVQYAWLPRDVYTNGDTIDRHIDDDYNDDDHNHGVDDGSQTKERTKHERTHSRVVDQRYEIPTNGDSNGNGNNSGIMLYRVRWCTTMISRPSAIWFYSPSCRRRCDKYESIRHLATSKWPISNGGTGSYRPSSPPSKVPHGNGNGMSDALLSSDPPSSPDTDGSTSSSLSSSALSMPMIPAVTGERRRCRQLTGDIPRIIPSDVNQSAGRIIGTSHTRGGRRRQAWHVIWQDTWEPIQLLTRDIHRHWTVHCKQHGLPVPPPFGMDPDHTAVAASSTSASSSSGSSLRRSNDSKTKKRHRNDADTCTKDGGNNDNGNGVDGDSNASIITHKRVQKATPKVLAMTSFGSLPSSSNRASQSSSLSVTGATHRRASSNPTYDRPHGHIGHTSSIGSGNGSHHRTLSAPNIPTLNGTLVNDVSSALSLPSSSPPHGHGDDVSNYFHLRFHDHGAPAGYDNHTNGHHTVNHDATSLSHRPLHHSQPYMKMATNPLSSSINGGVDAAMAIDNHQAHQPHVRSMVDSPRMVMRTSSMDASPSLSSPMVSTSHDTTPHYMHAVGILTPQRSWPSTPYASPSPSSSSSQKQHHVGHNNAASTIDHDTSLSLSSSSSSSLSFHNPYGTSEVDGFLADLSPIPVRDASMMTVSQHQHEHQQQQRRVHDAAVTTPRPSVPSSQLSSSSLSSLQLSPIACVTTEMNQDTRDTSLLSTSNNMKENEHGNNGNGSYNGNSSGNSNSTRTSFRGEVTPSVGSNGVMHGHASAHGHGHGVSFSFSVSSISS